MPVENKYTDANLVANKKTEAYKVGSGSEPFILVGTVSVAAADDDGSIFRVFASVPSNAIPISLEVVNTAITGGTSYGFGLYRANLGSVVNATVLASAIDMSSARTIATSNNVGLSALTLGELRTLASLSGATNPDDSYDIALTATTVGTAAGTIRVRGVFVFN